MQSQSDGLVRHRDEVRQLANKVHQAKVAMDATLWGAGGLPTDPEALARSLAYLRSARGPHSVMIAIKEAHHLTLAYRKAQGEFMLAQAELDALSSHAVIPDRVKKAREKMRNRFAKPVQQAAAKTGAFNLANDPGLTKAVSEALSKAVRMMNSERSVGGIAALVGTLGAAESMGFDSVRPGECRSALDNAKRLAEQLLKKAKMRTGPSSPVLERNLLQLRALVQSLGG